MAKYDSLPNISVNLNQVRASRANVIIPFKYTAIVKAKTGPIEEIVQVNSYQDAVNTFGLGDATTPALYGIEQVLRSYGYANIIRVASTAAAKGTIAIAARNAQGEEYSEQDFPGHVLIEGTTDYKTDIYNGDEIQLKYNAERSRLYLTAELDGTPYTTPLEIIDLTTATAPVLSGVLDKLVSNWNELGTGVTLENKFINKVAADHTLSATDYASGTISTGDSGNDSTTPISNDTIVQVLKLIEDPKFETQDVVIVPEFRNYKVANACLALNNVYFYIGATAGDTLAAKQESITNYEASDKGVLYIPSKCKLYDDSIEVPFECAALYAWATTFSENRYLAPAGVKRASLPFVSDILDNLSDADAEVLYNNAIPANPVKYITDYGYTIYGQKTMDPSKEFTNRINVSGIVSYIFIEGKKLLNPYIFEYTPVSTFEKVHMDLDKLLSTLAINEILYNDYQIVCDSSNNTTETLANHELHVAVAIRPINVTEYIILDLTVTDSLGGEE